MADAKDKAKDKAAKEKSAKAPKAEAPAAPRADVGGGAEAAKPAKAARADKPASADKPAKSGKAGRVAAGATYEMSAGRPTGPLEKPRFAKHYAEKVVPALMEKFGYKSIMQ